MPQQELQLCLLQQDPEKCNDPSVLIVTCLSAYEWVQWVGGKENDGLNFTSWLAEHCSDSKWERDYIALKWVCSWNGRPGSLPSVSRHPWEWQHTKQQTGNSKIEWGGESLHQLNKA